MIDFFESCVRINSSSLFFSFTEKNSREFSYTYWQARLISASLARKLHRYKATDKDAILIDLPNCPEFIFIALACAYSGFTMVIMDSSLSDAEKLSRRLEVERAGYRIAASFNYQSARHALECVRNLPLDSSEIVRQIYGQSRRSKSIMGENQDLIDDTVHFAERASHLFNREAIAIILFAESAKTPNLDQRTKSRAVPLTWEQLLSSSDAANEFFSTGASRLWQERLPFNSFSDSGSLRASTSVPLPVWQCALPLSTIAGFQTLVRSILTRKPLYVYACFDAEQLLLDAERGLATHVSVNDLMLQDLMTVEEWRGDAAPGISSRLALYQCVLLIDRYKNPRTIKRAYDLGARLFVSYGMAQTSGDIAISAVDPAFQGGLRALSGYEMRVIDPDEDGCGRLAVRGTGVFDGYLRSRTAFTVDRFYITEDKAIIEDGQIFIRDRAQNMFVSAGQNIYPVEIADVLRHVPGVSGVHVFGVPDSKCGMLPIAVLERSDTSLTPQDVEETTRTWFASFSVPISIFVFDELPRTSHGKLDRAAIEQFFSS